MALSDLDDWLHDFNWNEEVELFGLWYPRWHACGLLSVVVVFMGCSLWFLLLPLVAYLVEWDSGRLHVFQVLSRVVWQTDCSCSCAEQHIICRDAQKSGLGLLRDLASRHTRFFSQMRHAAV